MNIKINVRILVAVVALSSCSPDQSQGTTEHAPAKFVVRQRPDYATFKQSVKSQRTNLSTLSSKDLSTYLFNLLNDDIYFYWKGTPWDFNGMTQKPPEGNIACGYFITNTLTDLGFKIPRIKFAQLAASEMIKALSVDVHRFSTWEDLQRYLNEQPDHSVYVIGLDFHVGYILKDSTASYFMHSNYIKREGVVKEKIEESRALRNTTAFMIGSLTSNKKMLEKWVNENSR